jgi:hypothetical protein
MVMTLWVVPTPNTTRMARSLPHPGSVIIGSDRTGL